MSEAKRNELAGQPGSVEMRRRSKLLALTVIATMLDNWMCDGYPSGNDSDEYDASAFLAEASRWQGLVDARVAKLRKPNDQA